jgi:hypothetical protein
MRCVVILWIAGFFFGCSVITNPDELTYEEGSPEDQDRSGGDPNKGNDTGPDESKEGDTGPDTGEERDTGEPLGKPGDPCERHSDCVPGAICPKILEAWGFEELESHCYLDCDGAEESCGGTGYPSCFDYDFGAVCQRRVMIEGNFVCRVTGATGSQLELRLDDNVTIQLTECELWVDSDGLGFLFRGPGDGVDWEVQLYREGLVLADLVPGAVEDSSGLAFQNLVEERGGDFILTQSFVRAFFPPARPEQAPPLDSHFEIENVGNPTTGTVRMEGFAYRAEVAVP